MLLKLSNKCFAVFVLLLQAIAAHRFGYTEGNQRRWSRHHGHCAGKTQSPIAITASRTIPLHMPAIDMIGYHNLLPNPLKMVNNGHTVSITIPKPSAENITNGDVMPYIRGAKLPGEFELEGIHFHWGDRNNRGAEHVINDIRYTAEMHIVHRNKKYPSLVEALDHGDGAAVLGFFFELHEDNSDSLITIAHHLLQIPDANDEVALNVTFSIASLIAGVNLDRFFTYKGSLTTPPCSEAVTWILYPDPLPISSRQINRFRQLQDVLDDALVDNYRQLQPLGNRRIFTRVGDARHVPIDILKKEIDYRKWDWFY